MVCKQLHYSLYFLSLFPLLTSATNYTIKAGYWPSWRNTAFPPTSINFSYLTHAYYAFLHPHPTSFHLTLTSFDAELLRNFTSASHSHRPAAPVKAMLAINSGPNPTTFADLVSNRSNRAAFIGSSIAVARRFGLDGLDLDWEFPADGEQMAGLGDLITEWRDAVDGEGRVFGRPPLLLSAAVYFASRLSSTRLYPYAAISRGLDWINAMCFDYRGSWDTTATGAHAALYDPNSNTSTSSGIESWIRAGVPPEKLVMGLPLYGRTWQLKDSAEHGIGAPAVAVGPGYKGVMIYSAILEFNEKYGNYATVVYDDEVTVSMYSYAGTSWIGYDDPRSVAKKVGFAKGRGIGGYFFWALGYEDVECSISRAAWNAWAQGPGNE